MADGKKINLKARANKSIEGFIPWSGVIAVLPHLDGEVSAVNVINCGSKVMPWGRNVSGVLCFVPFAALAVFG